METMNEEAKVDLIKIHNTIIPSIGQRSLDHRDPKSNFNSLQTP